MERGIDMYESFLKNHAEALNTVYALLELPKVKEEEENNE